MNPFCSDCFIMSFPHVNKSDVPFIDMIYKLKHVVQVSAWITPSNSCVLLVKLDTSLTPLRFREMLNLDDYTFKSYPIDSSIFNLLNS